MNKFPFISVLDYYLNRSLLGRFLICEGVLISLLEILALLEQTTPILNRHLGFKGILTFFFLHLPSLYVEVIPFSFLVGGLFFLTQITLSSEISALRAAGLSTSGLYKKFIPAILIVGLSGSIINYWVVPPCETALTSWWNKTDPNAENPNNPDQHTLWLRAGLRIISIGQYAKGGAFLRNVTIYHRDENGLLTQTEHADTLFYKDKAWVPTGTQNLSLTDDQSFANVTPGNDHFIIPLTPTMIMALSRDNAILTPKQLFAIIHQGAPASLPRANYKMAVLNGIILPFQVAVMLLFALPVIYIPPRAGLRTPLPIYVLAGGLGLIILQGMISALGNAGTIAAPLAAGSEPLLGALIGMTWLLRMEEI
ncbi:LptF/LptG family permease [Swingsia samuiensis]|uniref:YjgP/YjgQ family permease n=1 Tax=Swingsia samuiensis TaxID=1293412 RepID=A0A4Y6UJD5_9PROT|nr:LptF/LptG family permease [Swingsia samuiensis]QDH17713.1 YjgP/YjgQ family permease [Swingsia samuiensis]